MDARPANLVSAHCCASLIHQVFHAVRRKSEYGDIGGIGTPVNMVFQLTFQNVVYIVLHVGQFFFACRVCDNGR